MVSGGDDGGRPDAMASGGAAEAAASSRQGWGERLLALLHLLTSLVLSALYLVPATFVTLAAAVVGFEIYYNLIGAAFAAQGTAVLVQAGAALAFAVLGMLGARLSCALQRRWLGDAFGVVETRPPEPDTPSSPPGRALNFVFGAEAWGNLLYCTVAGLLGLTVGGMVLGLVVFGLGGVAAAAIAAGYVALGGDASLGALGGNLLLAAAGVPVALWLAPFAVRLEYAIARTMLFDAPEVRVRRRLMHVQDSRSRMVDAAEAERRRIERDLHDGAQQRLLAVTLTLSRARSRFDRDPRGARDLLDEAQAEAKEVMEELREVARGLHPRVLTDHGLEAALPVAAGRAPVPVKVEVDLDGRPSPRAEGVAYSVASEALTNIAKHAHASSARVAVHRVAARRGDLLRVTVGDDGAGGADPERGTGLYGLWDRLDAVDGRLEVRSPEGGGTVLTAEIPWEA
ncbi:sensor histidine kinase [Nocardiopsis suaedae]|uniref:histidine kinase n=1 Tax=Nocardiopsis suaedae TaxID=3018444 RepID=A0ABT4TUL5_9ACTN|nr:sensor histidine kinase [Nocardiopsis suaedae]MDA2807890.1 sensor histidine kinase [Nocardiopsis suaedae]